jgi:hypothetical protein
MLFSSMIIPTEVNSHSTYSSFLPNTLQQAFIYPVLDCTVIHRRFQKSASPKRFHITQWYSQSVLRADIVSVNLWSDYFRALFHIPTRLWLQMLIIVVIINNMESKNRNYIMQKMLYLINNLINKNGLLISKVVD